MSAPTIIEPANARSRRTRALRLATRSELVAALFDWVAETDGLHASLSNVCEAPTGAAALDEWFAHLARYHPQLLAAERAVQQMWREDPDTRAHRDRVDAGMLANCRRLPDRRWSRRGLASHLSRLFRSTFLTGRAFAASTQIGQSGTAGWKRSQ